ncbi:hypothetical protein ACIBG8_07635 [Nonomuraea sp. NPDC050556]|uniref:hypothetical protein n=1 Tax=Nonomuraea sp. NPDC050556 TaxID=3364369 RepID=UPI0037938080
MTAVTWSRLLLPLETNWPCGATGCDDIAVVAATIDGWRYGLCQSDAELIPGFDPALLETAEPPPEATQPAMP